MLTLDPPHADIATSETPIEIATTLPDGLSVRLGVAQGSPKAILENIDCVPTSRRGSRPLSAILHGCSLTSKCANVHSVPVREQMLNICTKPGEIIFYTNIFKKNFGEMLNLRWRPCAEICLILLNIL